MQDGKTYHSARNINHVKTMFKSQHGRRKVGKVRRNDRYKIHPVVGRPLALLFDHFLKGKIGAVFGQEKHLTAFACSVFVNAQRTAYEFNNQYRAGAYIAAGLVLFLLTLVVNAIAREAVSGKAAR